MKLRRLILLVGAVALIVGVIGLLVGVSVPGPDNGSIGCGNGLVQDLSAAPPAAGRVDIVGAAEQIGPHIDAQPFAGATQPTAQPLVDPDGDVGHHLKPHTSRPPLRGCLTSDYWGRRGEAIGEVTNQTQPQTRWHFAAQRQSRPCPPGCPPSSRDPCWSPRSRCNSD